MTHLLSPWPRFIRPSVSSAVGSVRFFVREVPGQGCRRIVLYNEGVKVFIKNLTILPVTLAAYKSAVVNKAVHI